VTPTERQGAFERGVERLLRRVRSRMSRLLPTRRARRHALSGPIYAWKLKRDYQFWFLREHGLRPEHHFLEIGCGTLRGGLPVIAYLDEGHYYGVDVREVALEEARKELAEARLEHKRPTLRLVDDLAAADLGRTFDFVWAFSVLPHIADEVLPGVLAFGGSHLAPDGRLLATVQIGAAREDGTWDAFPNLWRPLAFYERAAEAHGLVVEDLGPLSALGHPPDVVNAHHHMLLFTLP
jgi:SAM-dependent methyltransferase